MLVPGGFAAMFTSDAELLDYTRTALRIYMAAMFLMGIQMACQMTFNALGKATESIVVAVMRKFVLLIPLIYIMPHMIRGQSDHGRLSGRAGRGHPGRNVHGDPVYGAVQEDPEEDRDKVKRPSMAIWQFLHILNMKGGQKIWYGLEKRIQKIRRRIWRSASSPRTAAAAAVHLRVRDSGIHSDAAPARRSPAAAPDRRAPQAPQVRPARQALPA